MYLSFIGLLPVLLSAIKSIIKGRVSVDLLASIALIFSIISHEWFSAAFITLMLAFARIFDLLTMAKTKSIIQSLMKYHVEWVTEEIESHIKHMNQNLASFETIKKYKILQHDFTIESGELTPSLKIKRKVITQNYKNEILEMYS
jgi:long-subunit acyl-CoA synthetase (AMP-forming)